MKNSDLVKNIKLSIARPGFHNELYFFHLLTTFRFVQIYSEKKERKRKAKSKNFAEFFMRTVVGIHTRVVCKDVESYTSNPTRKGRQRVKAIPPAPLSSSRCQRGRKKGVWGGVLKTRHTHSHTHKH